MPYLLSDELIFPNPRDAWEENNGLVAVGGDLRPERLLLAYTHGIFPWYSENDPIYGGVRTRVLCCYWIK